MDHDAAIKGMIETLAAKTGMSVERAKAVIERNEFRKRIIGASSLLEIKQILLAMNPPLGR